jgi:hypothetical protein
MKHNMLYFCVFGGISSSGLYFGFGVTMLSETAVLYDTSISDRV